MSMANWRLRMEAGQEAWEKSIVMGGIKHKSPRQKPSGFALAKNRSVEQFIFLAPRAGLEPATKWLQVALMFP